MTADLTFVDTNVLIYAHDRSAAQKHERARHEIAALWESGEGALSTQVLQEFYVNVTRKVAQPLPRARARTIVGRYSTWQLHRVDASDVIRASELEETSSISFRDALIVVAAARLGAVRLLTEDMQHGQVIAGLRIENPFAPG
jgi:predicted nucleic acid-binding protein